MKAPSFLSAEFAHHSRRQLANALSGISRSSSNDVHHHRPNPGSR